MFTHVLVSTTEKEAKKMRTLVTTVSATRTVTFRGRYVRAFHKDFCSRSSENVVGLTLFGTKGRQSVKHVVKFGRDVTLLLKSHETNVKQIPRVLLF